MVWRVRGSIAYPFIYLVVAGCGVSLGVLATSLHRSFVRDSSAEERRQAAQAYLRSTITDLSIGQVFPEIPLIAPDNRTVYAVRDLLPRGGLILFVLPECGSCYQSIINLEKLIVSKRLDWARAIVVASGDPGDFIEHFNPETSPLRILFDISRALPDGYGVKVFPTMFCVDTSQVVTDMMAEARTSDDFQRCQAK